MRTHAFRRALALAALVLAITGCDVVDAITSASATATTATLTIWTSDSAPSPIAVAVDGSALGTLTAYRTAAPVCGVGSSAGALTMTVTPGIHVIRAYETRSSGTWGPATVTVSAGGCLTYELTD